MPWEEANLLREIGKRSEGEFRRTNLEAALKLFTACQARYDVLDTEKINISLAQVAGANSKVRF